MACVRPFAGLLYNQNEIGDFSSVVAPPYDVITPEQQEQFYQKHPYNIIRLILGKEECGDTDINNKYTRAARYLATWQEKKVLKRTPAPAVYFYTQDYFLPDGEARRRKGFISLIKVEDFSARVVLPHERTMSKPKADRLNLTLACRANFNPIFSLYADPELTVEKHVDAVAEKAPYLDVTDGDRVRHQLWVVDNPAIIEDVTRVMRDKQVLIADGHHRYETALNYRNLMQKQHGGTTGNEAFNYTMMYFSNMNDVGLAILPTHRLVKNIHFSFDAFYRNAKDYFDVETVATTPGGDGEVRKKIMARLKDESTTHYLFGLYTRQEDSYYIFRLKKYAALDRLMGPNTSLALRQLDAHIMEAVIFQGFLGLSCSDIKREAHIAFAHAEQEAVGMVQSGDYEVAFLVNPTRIEQVQEIVTKGEIMPQKSTYFYPKLLSGLTINKIDLEALIE